MTSRKTENKSVTINEWKMKRLEQLTSQNYKSKSKVHFQAVVRK